MVAELRLLDSAGSVIGFEERVVEKVCPWLDSIASRQKSKV